MRHYEIVFLVHPDQSEQVPAMIDRYKDMVTSGSGIIHRVEDWGRKRLAYVINDVHKAHYIMVNIECSLEVLREIEKNFKFNDSILRHLVIRRKTALTEESPLAAAKARDDAVESERAVKHAVALDNKTSSESDNKTSPESDDKTSSEAKEEIAEDLKKPDEENGSVKDATDEQEKN